MAKTFKVGDKVRILDVDAILFGSEYWRNGDVVAVASIDGHGDPRLARFKGDARGLGLFSRELHAIELVEETPKLTKKARIEALGKVSKEQADFNEATADDFADLLGRIEALEKRLAEQKGDQPVTSDKITSVNDVKLGDKIAIVGYLSDYLRANSSYEVVEIRSGKSRNGQQIVVLDDDGDNYNLPGFNFSKLRKVAS